jgi:NAD(P)-dependent dehydrogenase (short-subunit alcohol dehydrogenase family)
MSDDLTGQVALVTGASRGLGRGFAVGLARAGANVGVTARSVDDLNETARLVEAAGGRAVAVPADVSSRADVDRVVEAVERDLGPIDVLVNNAGASPLEAPMWEVDPDDWWRILETNLRGAVLLTRAVMGGMVERGRGRIVNIVSEAGNNPEANLSAYSTSKAALIHFTECMALAGAEHGVGVFAYHPGMVRTAMTEELIADPKGGTMGERLRAAFAEGRDTPIGRSVERFMFLAGGRGDVLSGRYIMSRQTEDEILALADEIRGGDLFKLRVVRPS